MIHKPAPKPPTMTAAQLCAAFQSAGLDLAAEGRSGLSVRPRSAITERLAEAIRHHKSGLVALVKSNQTGSLVPYICQFCEAEFVTDHTRTAPGAQNCAGKCSGSFRTARKSGRSSPLMNGG